jgi:hypothetical protein
MLFKRAARKKVLAVGLNILRPAAELKGKYAGVI